MSAEKIKVIKEKFIKSQEKAWFECINGCERYSIDDIIYNCKKCGDLLEVKQDINFLKKRSGDNWRKIFDATRK